MTSGRVDVPPARRLHEDAAWVLGSALLLGWLSNRFGLPYATDARIWWASAALAAILATAPRPRWGLLCLAAWPVFALALGFGGETPDAALLRGLAYALEGACGGLLATWILRRTRGAETPPAFAILLLAMTLAPPLVGASSEAAGLWLIRGSEEFNAADAAHLWLATWSGDAFGALGVFPVVLSLRRLVPHRIEPRRAAASLVLVGAIVAITLLGFGHLPRPFAFCCLVLGAAALLVDLRVLLVIVWACMTSATCAIGARFALPHGAGVAWEHLNLFLPLMAIAAPIQVLSMALHSLGRTNEGLQRSQRRLRSLYDHAPVMLQSLDDEGLTLDVNAQWLSTLGYATTDPVRGRPLEDFLAPAERGTSSTPWHLRLLASGHKLHLRLQTRRGQVVHTLASAAATPERRGAGGIVLAFEDVTAELAMRAELESERDQLAALSSATSDLAIFLDRDLRYRSVNRAFERYRAMPRQDAIGRHQRDIVGAEAFDRDFARPLQQALAGTPVQFQVAIDFPIGRRMMEASAAPAYDASGAHVGVVLTLHDVTELMEATRELRLLVEELQHANEGLEQFARIASHDLREPLNTITQFAGLISQDFGPDLPPAARRYFELMARASTRMKAMLDDVLMFARLERAPQVAAEAVGLERVFADLQVLLHARLAQTRAELAVQPALPQVLGQTSLVELLFQNLLINAMRYTAAGVVPRIEVGAECIGDTVIVTVADNGVGIPPDELERVFVPFHRLQAWRPNEDSGLGLAICRRIAAALGGRIWAESESGGGSRLKVALKAGPAAVSAPPGQGR